MFKRIYIFFFFYMAAMYFSQTLLMLWLLKYGFTFTELVGYQLITFLVGFAGVLYLPKATLKSDKALFWGIVLNLSYILLLIKIWSPVQLYVSAFVSGLNIIYFWITYNSMYFKYSSVENRGLNSGLMFLITPIIGITLQPLTGVIAEKFGFEMVFLIGVAMYLIPLFLIRYLPKFTWDLEVRKEFFRSRFNWSALFQGMASRYNYSVIPLFTLFFIKTPMGIGNFFGYLAIVAALASVLNGYISDKLKNRKLFFYFFTTLAVISFVPFAFIEKPYYWILFAGISSMCIYLANPFWLTYNLDYFQNHGVRGTMIMREIYLNGGYVINLFIIFLIFYFTGSIKYSLLTVSILCLFFPIVSYLQGAYRKKEAESTKKGEVSVLETIQ